MRMEPTGALDSTTVLRRVTGRFEVVSIGLGGRMGDEMGV
jgi:hypothetical protein